MKSLPTSRPGSLSGAPGADTPFINGTAQARARSAAGDPVRILVADGNAFARRLLESAAEDEIPALPLQRLAEALSAPLPAAPLPTVGGVARVTRWAALRGYAASIAGLGVIGMLASQWPTRSEPQPAALIRPSALQNLERTSEPERAITTAASTPGAVSTRPTAPSAAPPGAAPARDSASVPAGQPSRAARSDATRHPSGATRGVRPSEPSRATAIAEASTLTQELRALEVAQRALGMGQVDAAERALAAYARRFPRPILADEAELLAIDVLLARGQRHAAVARARALVARPGVERYRERLAALLHDETPAR